MVRVYASLPSPLNAVAGITDDHCEKVWLKGEEAHGVKAEERPGEKVLRDGAPIV